MLLTFLSVLALDLGFAPDVVFHTGESCPLERNGFYGGTLDLNNPLSDGFFHGQIYFLLQSSSEEFTVRESGSDIYCMVWLIKYTLYLPGILYPGRCRCR